MEIPKEFKKELFYHLDYILKSDELKSILFALLIIIKDLSTFSSV